MTYTQLEKQIFDKERIDIAENKIKVDRTRSLFRSSKVREDCNKKMLLSFLFCFC